MFDPSYAVFPVTAACVAALAVGVIGVLAQEKPHSILKFAGAAFLVSLLIGASASALQARSDERQGAMRTKIEAKYKVTLDKKAALPTSADDGAVDVVASAGGQIRHCLVQIVNKDPFVFCGDGVEADRK